MGSWVPCYLPRVSQPFLQVEFFYLASWSLPSWNNRRSPFPTIFPSAVRVRPSDASYLATSRPLPSLNHGPSNRSIIRPCRSLKNPLFIHQFTFVGLSIRFSFIITIRKIAMAAAVPQSLSGKELVGESSNTASPLTGPQVLWPFDYAKP
jgi:hypothetical protein